MFLILIGLILIAVGVVEMLAEASRPIPTYPKRFLWFWMAGIAVFVAGVYWW